jgi:hypothetical protein
MEVEINLTIKCELCLRFLKENPVTHIAGYPERQYMFCSDKCRDHFLRMEDDELEYRRERANKQYNSKGKR